MDYGELTQNKLRTEAQRVLSTVSSHATADVVTVHRGMLAAFTAVPLLDGTEGYHLRLIEGNDVVAECLVVSGTVEETELVALGHDENDDPIYSDRAAEMDHDGDWPTP